MLKIIQATCTRINYTVGRMIRETGLALERHGCRLEQDISCYEPLSRHRNVMPIYDLIPTFYQSSFVAPNSSLIGAVYLGQHSSIGYGSTLRGDVNAIRIGNRTSIGDKVSITNVATLGAGVPVSTTIGNNVTVGSGVVLQSCLIDDNATVGHSSVVLEGSIIERGAVVAPNSLVPAGRLIPSNQLWAGSPVRFVRDLSEAELQLQANANQEALARSEAAKDSLLRRNQYEQLTA